MATSIDKEQLLASAARRAAADRFFLASALTAYQAEHGLDDAALAARVGCAPDRLSRLALCRRPDPDSASFRADVERIGAYTGVQPRRLAALLRDVDAADALREDGPAGALLAARDAEADSSDEPG